MAYAVLLGFVALAVGALVYATQRARERGAHARLLGEILDLADRLEAELRECRARLRELPALSARAAPMPDVSARATLAAEPQVQDALRDLLAHRLWLKDHAAGAGIPELRAARDALASTRATLAHQMTRLAAARAELESMRAAHGAS